MVRGNFRRKSLDRQVVKTCPKCEKQIPVACKTCVCGHKFVIKNRTNSAPGIRIESKEDEDSSVVKIRRTERTRRERPDYFNPLLLETAVKRPRKKSQASAPVPRTPPPPPPPPVKKEEVPREETPKKRGRGRPKGAPNKPRSHLLDTNKLIKKESEDEEEYKGEIEEEEEIDMYADMTQERLKQFNFILEDLNRKFLFQGCQPR